MWIFSISNHNFHWNWTPPNLNQNRMKKKTCSHFCRRLLWLMCGCVSVVFWRWSIDRRWRQRRVSQQVKNEWWDFFQSRFGDFSAVVADTKQHSSTAQEFQKISSFMWRTPLHTPNSTQQRERRRNTKRINDIFQDLTEQWLYLIISCWHSHESNENYIFFFFHSSSRL